MGKEVIVIGAGMGGLSTAIRLQKEGYQVEFDYYIQKSKCYLL